MLIESHPVCVNSSSVAIDKDEAFVIREKELGFPLIALTCTCVVSERDQLQNKTI